MKKLEITLYSFDELSETAKKRAIMDNYDFNFFDDWWSGVYDDAENIGLKLTTFDLDRHRHAKGEFICSPAECAANILKEHGNMCETYKTAESFLSEYNPIFADYMDENSENYESADLEQNMIDMEEDFLNSLLKDYSIILQKECEYLSSDDAIIEGIKANEYLFWENGKMY
jgi:hypothetical protein